MVQKPNYLFCPCFALNEKVVGLAIVMQIQSSPHYNSETRYVSISIFHEDIPAPLGLKRNSTFFHHTTFLCVSLLKLRSCKITIALCRKKWFVAVLFFSRGSCNHNKSAYGVGLQFLCRLWRRRLLTWNLKFMKLKRGNWEIFVFTIDSHQFVIGCQRGL